MLLPVPTRDAVLFTTWKELGGSWLINAYYWGRWIQIYSATFATRMSLMNSCEAQKFLSELLHTIKNILAVKSKRHLLLTIDELLSLMTTSERPGWDLPAAPRQKKITTTVLLFLSVPQPRGLSTTMAIVAILSCDGNDIMIHLMSTIHINILGYRIIHVLRMKIIIIKKKKFQDSFSYPLSQKMLSMKWKTMEFMVTDILF